MRFALLAVAALAVALPASAQATRTWVSGVGDDVNPCSRTAPCKTFAGAISKTAAGGEISVLDPAGFGSVTITKSISIVADGAEGSILAGMTNGVIVNAGPNDVVSLRGLMIEGSGNGTNGVRFIAGGALTIQDSVIRGFQGSPGVGVSVETTSPLSRIYVIDTLISKNGAGVVVKPAAAAPPQPAPRAEVLLDRVQLVQNAGTAITADGANATVRVNASTLVGNGAAWAATNSGKNVSFGNNAVADNGQNTAPSQVVGLQ